MSLDWFRLAVPEQFARLRIAELCRYCPRRYTALPRVFGPGVPKAAAVSLQGHDETHAQICGDGAGKTTARPAYERDCPRFETLDQGCEYPDTMPKAVTLIDAEGRSCIYVPITQNGKMVDNQGFILDPEHE